MRATREERAWAVEEYYRALWVSTRNPYYVFLAIYFCDSNPQESLPVPAWCKSYWAEASRKLVALASLPDRAGVSTELQALGLRRGGRSELQRFRSLEKKETGRLRFVHLRTFGSEPIGDCGRDPDSPCGLRDPGECWAHFTSLLKPGVSWKPRRYQEVIKLLAADAGVNERNFKLRLKGARDAAGPASRTKSGVAKPRGS
jgi:hypothetical protein